MILHNLVNGSALKRLRHRDTADVDSARPAGDRFIRVRATPDDLIDQRAAAEVRYDARAVNVVVLVRDHRIERQASIVRHVILHRQISARELAFSIST